MQFSVNKSHAHRMQEKHFHKVKKNKYKRRLRAPFDSLGRL